MKKQLFVGLVCLVFAQSSLQALLSPLYQSSQEFKALTNDKKLLEKLEAGETVVAITRFDKKFQVLTNRKKILVDIVYDAPANINPAKFHFVIHDPQPR